MPLRETRIIFLDDLKEALRDKKILVILFFYIALMAFGIKKSSILAGQFYLILSSFIFQSHLNLPYEILLFYFVSIAVLPILSLLISYDCIAGEIGRKTMRNLATKARRDAIVTGKFLSVFTITIATNLIVFIGAAIYVYTKVGVFYFDQSLSLFGYLAFYSFYFVSLAVLASAITSNSTKSLFLGTFFFIIPFFFVYAKKLLVLSPYYYYKNGFYLLSQNLEPVRDAMMVFLISGIIFLGIALFAFRKRDL